MWIINYSYLKIGELHHIYLDINGTKTCVYKTTDQLSCYYILMALNKHIRRDEIVELWLEEKDVN